MAARAAQAGLVAHGGAWQVTEVWVVFQAIEPGLLAHLELDPSLAGPEIAVLCAEG